MNKGEICRKLAEAMEPEPKFFHGIERSYGGYWYRTEVPPSPDWKAIRIPGINPFNPFTSEADSALLLESMLWHVKRDSAAFFAVENLFTELLNYPEKDRKQATALAACKWHGIKVGEIE